VTRDDHHILINDDWLTPSELLDRRGHFIHGPIVLTRIATVWRDLTDLLDRYVQMGSPLAAG